MLTAGTGSGAGAGDGADEGDVGGPSGPGLRSSSVGLVATMGVATVASAGPKPRGRSDASDAGRSDAGRSGAASDEAGRSGRGGRRGPPPARGAFTRAADATAPSSRSLDSSRASEGAGPVWSADTAGSLRDVGRRPAGGAAARRFRAGPDRPPAVATPPVTERPEGRPRRSDRDRHNRGPGRAVHAGRTCDAVEQIGARRARRQVPGCSNGPITGRRPAGHPSRPGPIEPGPRPARRDAPR